MHFDLDWYNFHFKICDFLLNFPQGIFFFFFGIGRKAEAGPGTSHSSLAQVVLLNKKAQSSCKQSEGAHLLPCPGENHRATRGGREAFPALPATEQSSEWELGSLLGSSRLPRTQEQHQKNPGPITMIGFFLTAHIPSYFLLAVHPPPPLAFFLRSPHRQEDQKPHHNHLLSFYNHQTPCRTLWGKPLTCGHLAFAWERFNGLMGLQSPQEVLVVEAGCNYQLCNP